MTGCTLPSLALSARRLGTGECVPRHAAASQGRPVSFKLRGARIAPLSGEEVVPGTANYPRSNDRREWVTGVRVLAGCVIAGSIRASTWYSTATAARWNTLSKWRRIQMRIEGASRMVAHGRELRFAVAGHNRARRLVIGLVLRFNAHVWATGLRARDTARVRRKARRLRPQRHCAGQRL